MSSRLLDMYGPTGKLAELAKLLTDSDLAWEVKKLYAFRQLVLDGLEFGVGDRVAIRSTWRGVEPDSGWYPHREWMKPGQPGLVTEVDISPDTLTMRATVKFETEWTIHPAMKKGDEPSRYDNQTDYDGVTPKDRRHVFYFAVKHLRPATADDRPYQIADVLVGAS